MLGAILIVVVLLGLVTWVVVRTLRVPRRPDHEREQQRFRDPGELGTRRSGDYGG